MVSMLHHHSYPKSLIIGYGVTGKATGHALNIQDYVDLGDKAVLTEYDFLIFCLPTPTESGKQDISAIEGWLKKVKKLKANPVIIIRSTVLPGTTIRISDKYKLQIVHVPEFLTEATALEDAEKPEFLVIGAKDILLREKVEKLFLGGKCEPKEIILTDPTTAEMIKYAMNSFFALKVIMANQLWDVAKKTGADYYKVREALEFHKWGSKNGWDVWHRQKRGYSGKCLPKDVDAFVNAFNIPLMKVVKNINDKLLKNK